MIGKDVWKKGWLLDGCWGWGVVAEGKRRVRRWCEVDGCLRHIKEGEVKWGLVGSFA